MRIPVKLKIRLQGVRCTSVLLTGEVAAIYHSPVKTFPSLQTSGALRLILFHCAVFFLLAVHGNVATAHSQPRRGKLVAATPPMGWNSWDSYGRTLNEQSIKASAKWMAQHLKRFGWDYVVVDEGWYLANLDAKGNDQHIRFEIDAHGRYVPEPGRFPSAGKDFTFRPLADYLHSLGLKFGIHIIRGIPREAVARNLPIAGSSFHSADAADTSDVCPWNAYNYGLNTSHPASQAYYDSLARQYSAWAAIDKRDEVFKFAQMWRISDDVWDVWYSSKNFPQGVKNQFSRAALWAGVAQPGHWPDADMLPIGSLRPAAGWGEPRETRLSHDEQRTLLTLWSIFRSPLIMGGNLLLSDAWTTSLLTNAEVIAVDQHSRDNHPVITTDNIVIWTARPLSGRDAGRAFYVAVFNVSDTAQTVHYRWSDLGLSASSYRLRDLWTHTDLGSATSIEVTLPPHASVLYRAAPNLSLNQLPQ